MPNYSTSDLGLPIYLKCNWDIPQNLMIAALL